MPSAEPSAHALPPDLPQVAGDGAADHLPGLQVGWSLERRLSTGRGEVAYAVFGEGQPVVLVHGTPSHSLIWRYVALALARRCRVFVWDLLGFGESRLTSPDSLTLREHGQVLAELVESWGLDRPALVGHDIGGAISLRAHLLEGIEVSRLALIDAVVLRPWITDWTRQMQREIDQWHPLPNEELAQQIEEHLRSATAKPLPPDLFRALFGQWQGVAGQERYLRNLAQFDEADTAAFEGRLATLTVPTLVIWGEEDAWLPAETSHHIASLIPGAQRILVPGAGHFSMEDQPRQVAAALEAFLFRQP